MTYDEIKKRLTKCELQLKEFQDSTHPARKAKNFDSTVKKLTVLKESLEKQLKETEKGMIRTSDSGEAEKLAKKGLNVDLKTEQDGVAFSKEETMAIAKSVGKAVAKAIHSSGDEVAHMKARNIEENSFEIYVQYKNDVEDTFSFYISDDTLHLVDFSFDKELVDVGVKPSGEAVVHVDVLANELVKHFKAMQESKKLKEEKESGLSQEQTRIVAFQTEKALETALKFLGDKVLAIDTLEVEPNSFELAVEYEEGTDDQFSFYISDSALFLTDFSFKKELADIIIRPSGRAVVHVDLLAKELVNHFKSLKEGMSDQEFTAAREADRLQKHPEKDKIKKIQALIAAQRKNEEMEPEVEDLYQHDDEYLDQLKRKKEIHRKKVKESIFDTPRMGGFHSSKGVAGRSANTHAQDKAYADSNRKAYKKDDETIEEAPEGKYYFEVSQDDSTKALFIMDFMFRPQLEKTGKKGFELSQNVYSFENGEVASAAMKVLQDRSGVEIIDTNIGLDKNKELGLNEAPEGKYYIRVAVRDARKALELIDDSPAYSKAVEMDGSDTYYLTDEQLAHDLLMDLGARGIEVTDNNIDLDEASDYAKRRAAEKDYQPAKKDKPVRPYREPKTNDYFAYRKKRDIEEGDVDAEMDGGDLDIGHQDDEPNMLKQQVYDIATYAAKLYKQLDKYDRYDGEVDFPHWWQKKIILARDYVSAAQHYLEFEEKQPALDALALEEGVNEASHAKLKKEYDELVGKMKQLAQHFKTAEGEKKAKIVAALKQHTARKRELEKQIDSAVGGIGVGQELDGGLDEAQPTGFGTGQGRSKTISKSREKNPTLKDKLSSKEPPFKSSKYAMVKGVPHKVGPDGKLVPLKKLNEAKATCCGKCGRVHVKGSECKRPFLKGKDHCRYN